MAKKAQMNLGKALEVNKSEPVKIIDQSVTPKPKARNVPRNQKKQVPIYYDPRLHDALQTICFSERHKKTTINSLVMEGLELLFKEKGYPTIAEIVNGDKKVNV